MSQINGIIFDLGRVLINIDLSRGIMKHWSGNGVTGDVELLDQLYETNFFLDYERGRTSPKQFYRELTSHLDLNISFDTFVASWNNIFSANKSLEKLVASLQKKYRVGLLSDIDPLHWEYCRKNFPVIGSIARPALSFQIGEIKPHPRCYFVAADNLGLKPAECLFIDDRVKNVNGAIAVGMKAMQFINDEQLVNDLKNIGIVV